MEQGAPGSSDAGGMPPASGGDTTIPGRAGRSHAVSAAATCCRIDTRIRLWPPTGMDGVRSARWRFAGWSGRAVVLGAFVAELAGGGGYAAAAGDLPQPAPEVATAAREIEARLMAPCCFAQTVDNHTSPVADEIKQDIVKRLTAGESEAAILAAYHRRYGDRILAAPPARGFNVLAYVVPPLFFAGGVSAAAWWLSRRVRRPGAPPVPPTRVVDPRLRARLDTELARVEP